MKNLTDNGTLLTLGLVGVVAVAGALAPRGSRSWRPGRSRLSFDVGDAVTFDAGMGITRTVVVTHKFYDDEAFAPAFHGRDADGKIRAGTDDRVTHVVRGSGAKGSRTVAPAGSLAALTPKARASLPARDFVFPEERAYPIHDARHGQLALTYVAAPSNQHRRYQVMRAVFQRYPSLLAWWNGTNAGRKDPANPNSWRTTLYQYQGSLPRLTDLSERREVEAEIEALQALVASTPRTTRPRRAA